MFELGRWSSLVKDSGLGTEKASEPEIAGSNPARPTYTARVHNPFSCVLKAGGLFSGFEVIVLFLGLLLRLNRRISTLSAISANS